MAENPNNNAPSNNTPGGLYFIVGGLVVAVCIGAFVFYGNGPDGYTKTTSEQTTVAPAAAPAEGTTTTTTTKEVQQP